MVNKWVRSKYEERFRTPYRLVTRTLTVEVDRRKTESPSKYGHVRRFVYEKTRPENRHL